MATLSQETELLENMAALSHCDLFSKFDISKLLSNELYKNDFDDSEMVHFDDQLEIYYLHLPRDDRFAKLKGIPNLSLSMVKTGKHHSFLLVYKLFKLTLVLHIPNATFGSSPCKLI